MGCDANHSKMNILHFVRFCIIRLRRSLCPLGVIFKSKSFTDGFSSSVHKIDSGYRIYFEALSVRPSSSAAHIVVFIVLAGWGIMVGTVWIFTSFRDLIILLANKILNGRLSLNHTTTLAATAGFF